MSMLWSVAPNERARAYSCFSNAEVRQAAFRIYANAVRHTNTRPASRADAASALGDQQ
jgi:hypothetical protein